jgi:GT2 family glycosyltransferase
MLERVGLFDEDFHLMMEDVDLGWRVRMGGWICYCVPSAVVRHRYSATIGPYSALKAFYVERNRIWVAVKSFPLRMLWKSPYYTLVRYLHQARGVWRGEGASARFYMRYGPLVLALTLLRAYAGAARGLPAMLRKRRTIVQSSKVTTRQVLDWFGRFGIGARELASDG